jgi:hypothetical protein
MIFGPPCAGVLLVEPAGLDAEDVPVVVVVALAVSVDLRLSFGTEDVELSIPRTTVTFA